MLCASPDDSMPAVGSRFRLFTFVALFAGACGVSSCADGTGYLDYNDDYGCFCRCNEGYYGGGYAPNKTACVFPKSTCTLRAATVADDSRATLQGVFALLLSLLLSLIVNKYPDWVQECVGKVVTRLKKATLGRC